jgi:hypothetical protein
MRPGSQKKIPATEAAQRAGMSRERFIRKIQMGEIEGELTAGRWVVSEDSLVKFISRLESAEQKTSANGPRRES